jgi:hypothetical protein
MQPEFRPHRHLHRHGYDPRAGSPADWLSLILDSSSEEEVTSTARDYLAAWSPEELHRLPKECLPGRIRDGEDVGVFAFVLAHAHCFFRGANRDKNLLEKMMVFFTHAATRVAQLSAQNFDRSAASN